MTKAAPIGKRCDRCLCCNAVIVTASEALCAACDDGTHPAMPEGRPTPQLSGFVPETPLAVSASDPERKDAIPIQNLRSRRGPGKRIDLETRRAVLAIDPRISHSQVARRIGISDGSVKAIRMQAQATREAAARMVTELEESDWVPEKAVAMPETKAILSLAVTPKIMDAWWERMSLADKAALFTANYRCHIDGSVL